MTELKNVVKEIEFNQNYIGEGFINPPDNDFNRVNIVGQIDYLSGFNKECLYLFYEFELPLGWKIDNENEYYEIYKSENLIEEDINKLKSISQRSIGEFYVKKHGEILHNLNMPFELELLGHKKIMDKMFPKLLIQVNSVDNEGRHRIEGYSFLSIPNTSGYYNVKVVSYKPIEDKDMKIFSFFLGGSRRIPDLKDIAKSSGCLNENNIPTALNRYGIKTTASGYINISFNVSIQNKEIADINRKIIKDNQAKIAYSISSTVESNYKDNNNLKYTNAENTNTNENIKTMNFGNIGRFNS